MIKKAIISICAIFLFHCSQAQLLATVTSKQPIVGACDVKRIYALFAGFTGQVHPVGPITDNEIQNKLNSEVKFIKENPTFKGKLIIDIIINCQGKLVQCAVGEKSGRAELDDQ